MRDVAVEFDFILDLYAFHRTRASEVGLMLLFLSPVLLLSILRPHGQSRVMR